METSDGAGEIQLDSRTVSKPFVVADAVLGAAGKHKRPLGQLVGEVARVMFGPGKVQPPEYFQMRLFDAEAIPRDELPRFTGRRIEVESNLLANDIAWWRGFTEDKLAFHAALVTAGLPTPELVAAYHPSRRVDARAAHLRSREALQGFLADPANYPLFIKPNGLKWSLGTVSLAAVDAGVARDIFGRTLPVERLAASLDELCGDGGLVLQRPLRNHPVLEALCGVPIATVRMLVARTDAGVELLRSHIKLPAGRNIADNTWRSGNLAAPVDTATGAIGAGWSGAGLDAARHEVHPDTQAPLQVELPDWARAVALVTDGMGVAEGLRLGGWDVAFTPDGPVVVEVNADPDWKVNQRITGRGMRDARFEELLQRWRATPREQLG